MLTFPVAPATLHRMRNWPADGIALGADYNPEQWPEEVWVDDVARMQEAGVTFATVGVFSWSLLEPSPGVYTFDWLDRVLDLLHAGGIAVDLATATASPPPWFSHAHPGTLPVDHSGRTLWPGSRQSWCPSSTVFTEAATGLTEQMARRYHDHPALALWHVSNEYACHNAPCYCDTCAGAFRTWLDKRYGDLDTLNAAWGTAFWSQRYTNLAQVLPPRISTAHSNPTQELDYRRFTSDALLAQHQAELSVLRVHSPGVPVTTNFMTLDHFRHLDYTEWTGSVDVVSTDHYVSGDLTDPEAELSFAADLTRGLAGGAPWLLMEHSTSAVNWQPVNRAKTPGQLLRHSLTHVARGADTLGFFQWRQSRAGAEKFHSAMLPHAGTGSKVWRDVVALGRAAAALGEVLGSRVEADVALLWDYQSGWALNAPSHPSSQVEYGEVAHDLHAALRRAGVTVDVVGPRTDLSGYRVVLVPTLYLASDETLAAVAAAARAGAQVLLTYFSGVVDAHDHLRGDGWSPEVAALTGARTTEHAPLLPQARVALDGLLTGSATRWSEWVDVEDGTEVLSRATDGDTSGQAVLTRRPVGSGAAWYLATRPDAAGLDALLARVCADAAVSPAAEVGPGVEVVRRRSELGSWLFVINHADVAAEVPASGHELLSGTDVDHLSVPAGGVAVLREA
jgi:beta-galactosidase